MLLSLLVTVMAGYAVGGAQPAVAGGTAAVEISGRISKVTLDRGEGTPVLEVKSASGRVWTVWLGSVRYLVEQNFNPKVGQVVSVKGRQKPDCPALDRENCPGVLASSVTLIETGQTVRLRDDTGRPVWRCARCGRRSP